MISAGADTRPLDYPIESVFLFDYFFTDENGSELYQLSKVLRLICDMYVSFYGFIIFCFDIGVE